MKNVFMFASCQYLLSRYTFSVIRKPVPILFCNIGERRINFVLKCSWYLHGELFQLVFVFFVWIFTHVMPIPRSNIYFLFSVLLRIMTLFKKQTCKYYKCTEFCKKYVRYELLDLLATCLEHCYTIILSIPPQY